MRKLLILFVFLLVVYLSYEYSLFSFFLIALIGIILVYLLILGAISLMGRKAKRNRFVWPVSVVAVSVVGIGVRLLCPLPAPVVDTEDVGEVLEYAYTTDQGDRKNLKFFLGPFREQMKKRDSVRLGVAKRLYEDNRIESPMAKFHAAFILHHNYQKDSTLYKWAHQLASEAAQAPDLKGMFQAQWLAKATYDRWMLSLGKPQKYDTQGGVSFSLE